MDVIRLMFIDHAPPPEGDGICLLLARHSSLHPDTRHRGQLTPGMENLETIEWIIMASVMEDLQHREAQCGHGEAKDQDCRGRGECQDGGGGGPRVSERRWEGGRSRGESETC